MTKPSGIPPAPVPCKDCGVLIERKYGGRGQKPQRCDECRKKHGTAKESERNRVRVAQRAASRPKACPRCGGEIDQRPHRRTPFCAACYPIVRRERLNAKERNQRATRERACRDCGVAIPYNGKRRPRWCKACSTKRRRATQYGITVAVYDAMLETQGHACAICDTKEPGKRGWFVDHDHGCCDSYRSCGTCVRGLVCNRCNLLLGAANDDPQILLRATEYLRPPLPLNQS